MVKWMLEVVFEENLVSEIVRACLIVSSTVPTYATHCHPWICGQTRRSEYPAGQMDGEAGWWITSRKIGLPPLARVMGVGKQQLDMN